MKIGIVGVYSYGNVGDNILGEVTEYLVQKNFPDAKTEIIDLNDRDITHYPGFRKLMFGLSGRLLKWEKRLFKYENKSRFRYLYERFLWHIKCNWQYKKKLSKLDGIVFGGGGYLKFKTQGLNYLVEMVVKIAEKNNIPILFLGVGTEGYSDSDIRCIRLKKAVNSDVVKILTTRDDVNLIREKFIVNKNIVVDQVGDVAFWTPEAFGLKGLGSGEPRFANDPCAIGINAINPRNFINYGGKVKSKQIEILYVELLAELKKRGFICRIFSNGMKPDNQFARKISLKKEGFDSKKKFVPLSSEEYLKELTEFDLVFAGRMHAGIIALSLGIPVVGLSWAEKIDNFIATVDLQEKYFDERNLSVKKIADEIEKSLKFGYGEDTIGKFRALKKKTDAYIKDFLSAI